MRRNSTPEATGSPSWAAPSYFIVLPILFPIVQKMSAWNHLLTQKCRCPPGLLGPSAVLFQATDGFADGGRNAGFGCGASFGAGQGYLFLGAICYVERKNTNYTLAYCKANRT